MSNKHTDNKYRYFIGIEDNPFFKAVDRANRFNDSIRLTSEAFKNVNLPDESYRRIYDQPCRHTFDSQHKSQYKSNIVPHRTIDFRDVDPVFFILELLLENTSSRHIDFNSFYEVSRYLKSKHMSDTFRLTQINIPSALDTLDVITYVSRYINCRVICINGQYKIVSNALKLEKGWRTGFDGHWRTREDLDKWGQAELDLRDETDYHPLLTVEITPHKITATAPCRSCHEDYEVDEPNLFTREGNYCGRSPRCTP